MFLIGTIVAGYASDYKDVMIASIEKMNNSQNPTELVEIANTFDRIAQKETNEWLPLYYSAYSNISTTFFNHKMTNDEKLKMFDIAQQKIDQAVKITDKESEIYVLQAMIHQLRISTDMANAYSYTIKIDEALGRAEVLDAKNPRIPYLRGTTLFYTPSEYGGGPSVAKPLLEKAAGLFKTADTTNPLMPNWGAYHNNMVLEQCGK
jgi:tetratricopeptide (TPR) repeat protein